MQDHPWLTAFIASYPDPHGGAAIAKLDEHLAAHDADPFSATVAMLDLFEQRGLLDCTPDQQKAYPAALAALYEAVAADDVERALPSVCIRAGADPVAVSPDRAELRAFIELHADVPGCARGMRVLADLFGVMDKGPLAADAWEASAAGGASSGDWIAKFYAAQALAGRVTLAIALTAGADPLVVSPDRERLRAFGSQHPSVARWTALRLLGKHFGRHERGPLSATPKEIKQLLLPLRVRYWHTPGYAKQLAFWIGQFYEAEQVDEATVAAARALAHQLND